MVRSLQNVNLRPIVPFFVLLSGSVFAFATTPKITITSPKNDSTSTSPVNFKATAMSSSCAQGISAMRVYSAPGVTVYTVAGGNLDAYLNLNAGTYNATIVAWDNCGGTASENVTVTASGEKKMDGFLYTVNTGYPEIDDLNNVVGFSIVASNGALAPLLQGAVNTNLDPLSAASDKGGYRFYVGDYESGDVFAYFIDRANGYLTAVPGAPFAVNRSVSAVAVHPSGDFVYAAADEQAAGDGIAVFQVQSDGSLTEIAGSPFATENGPQALVVDPTGNYLYVADYSNNIQVFRINRTTGALTQISGSPYSIPIPASCGSGQTANPTDLLEVSGKWIYTPDEFIGYISGWSTSSNGGLTPISGSPWIDQNGCTTGGLPGPEPYWLAVDGTGKYLYVSSETLFQGILIYSIGSNGALTYVKAFDAGSYIGQGPIATDSKGDYLYASEGGANVTPGPGYGAIAGFSINHSTGDLKVLPTSPYIYPETNPEFLLTSVVATP